MDVSKYLKKFKVLFDNIYEEKIVLNESDAEKLLKFLDDQNEDSPGKRILASPDFSDLIYHSLHKINDVSIPVQVFLIEVITLLFKNELQFSKMQIQGYQKLFLAYCVQSSSTWKCPFNTPLGLHLAFIHLATAEITHCSGIDIIIQNKVWQKVLFPEIHKKPKQISNAAYNFIAKLVWKLNNRSDKETELMEVLTHVVEPILSNEYSTVSVLDVETDAIFAEKIFANLHALLAVMRESDSHAPVSKVMTLIKDHFMMDIKIYELYEATKNPNLKKLLNSCLFWFFLQAYRHLLYVDKTNEFCTKMAACHRNYVVRAVMHREPFNIIDFAIKSNIIWSYFEKAHANEITFPLIFESNGKNVDLSIQLLVHLLVPMLKSFRLHHVTNKLETTDVIEHFFSKLNKNTTDFLYSSCVLFGDILEEVGPTCRKKLTTHTLKELLRLKGHLNDSQAGFLFQSLYYMLEVFILYDDADGLIVDMNPVDPDDLRLLTHLLNAMKMLLKEHNISWYENFEVINIKAELLNLLKQSFLTTKLVFQIIDLINICVERFLSPNMSLLVDDQCPQGNTLSEIGEVIKLYTQHEDWEVRDSALNLLRTCTEICFIKYVPLQKIIRDKNLISIAAKAALTDVEYYSQCTALRCLRAATKVSSIWQDVLVDNPSICLQLVSILRHHNEGMVRKEAVNVLTEMYQNQKTAPSFQSTLYEIMQMAALDDLHWEVQLAALKFWRKTIDNYLTYRGMICGRKFPSVTFSKEKRKIIVLNDAEIQRQLTEILSHLSSIGCLTVLLGCMNELNNIEVMDQAYRIAKEFIEILDNYRYVSTMEHVTKHHIHEISKREMIDDNKIHKIGSEEDRNKVIDSILSVDLSELIINLHDSNYRAVKSEEAEMDNDFLYLPQRELVHPDTFLAKFKSNDYYEITISKKSRFREFSTLDRHLDELLDSQVITYQVNNV